MTTQEPLYRVSGVKSLKLRPDKGQISGKKKSRNRLAWPKAIPNDDSHKVMNSVFEAGYQMRVVFYIMCAAI